MAERSTHSGSGDPATKSKPPRVGTPYWVAMAGMAAALAAEFAHPQARADLGGEGRWLLVRTVEYLSFAVVAFAIFWLALGRLIPGRKLSRDRLPRRDQVFAEILFSSTTNLITLALGVWIAGWAFPVRPVPNMYTDIAEHGLLYYAASVLVIFVLHDTWFYWMHRALHSEALFSRFHRTHHESRDPTPFTTFHFHPVEGLLEALGSWVIVIPMLFLPWHESLLGVFFFGMLIFNTIGHLGYEVYPSWWHRVPILSGKTTAMHHYMHHQRVGGNYGLYFRFWDRLCGTEFPDYEERYDRLFARMRDAKAGHRQR